MKHGKITAETAKHIDGLNVMVYLNADGSVVVELPHLPHDDASAILYTAICQSLAKEDRFPERKKRDAGEPLTLESLDRMAPPLNATHLRAAGLESNTDWLECDCGSILFTAALEKYSDHSVGIVGQCQKCGRLLGAQKGLENY